MHSVFRHPPPPTHPPRWHINLPVTPLSLHHSGQCATWTLPPSSLSLILCVCVCAHARSVCIPSRVPTMPPRSPKWLRNVQWCRCSQSCLSAVDGLCEAAAQRSDGSDGTAGQVHRARGETITCLEIWDEGERKGGKRSRRRRRRRRRSWVCGRLKSLCVCSSPLTQPAGQTARQPASQTDALSPCLSLLSPPMLVWWTAEHSRLSCMEAQGGAGSPGKSHFLFFQSSVPKALQHGCCSAFVLLHRPVSLPAGWYFSMYTLQRVGLNDVGQIHYLFFFKQMLSQQLVTGRTFSLWPFLYQVVKDLHVSNLLPSLHTTEQPHKSWTDRMQMQNNSGHTSRKSCTVG